MNEELKKIESKMGHGTEHEKSLENLEEELNQEVIARVYELEQNDQEVQVIEQSVALESADRVDEIKSILHLDDELAKIHNQAEALKHEILSSLGKSEKNSIFDKLETIEQKKEKIESWFANLDIEELHREDIETNARGWNATCHLNDLEKFKKRMIDSFDDHHPYYTIELPLVEKLISQTDYQNIVWATTTAFPDVFTHYQGNEAFNAFIQERPEFLESLEFDHVRLAHIKKGIDQGNLFLGMRDVSGESKTGFPDRKNFFKQEEDPFLFIDTNNGDSKKESDVTIPDSDKGFIVNLKQYEFDRSHLDKLNPELKSQLVPSFLEKVGDYRTYGRYHSRMISADEVFEVGKKLGISHKDVSEIVYDAFLEGVTKGVPPINDIDQDFARVYERMQVTLSDPEKRAQVLNEFRNYVINHDNHFENWNESIIYLDLDEKELAAVRTAYLDCSSKEDISNKIIDIFGYPWWKKTDFLFSQQEQLDAFQTMNPEQRSRILYTYQNSDLEKIKHLPFTREDVLHYAVNTLDNQHSVWKNDADNALRKVQEKFPEVHIDTIDIIKTAVFKNGRSLDVIESNLVNNQIYLSPAELMQKAIDHSDNASSFIQAQIQGGPRALEAFEVLRKNPQTPTLEVSDKEIFQGIKSYILKNQVVMNHYRDQFSKMIDFIPKNQKIEMFSDPDLQKLFSRFYQDSLQGGNFESIQKMHFLIPQSESLVIAENEVIQGYENSGDLSGLSRLYKTLGTARPDAPTLQTINGIFSEKLQAYGYEVGDKILGPQNVSDIMHQCALENLHALTPENIGDEKHVFEWMNILHGGSSDKMARVYLDICNLKDFNFFNENIKNELFQGFSENFIYSLQKAQSGHEIEQVVRFTKEIKYLFDGQFLKEHWEYLFNFLNVSDPQEYQERLDILKQSQKVNNSRFKGTVSFQQTVDKMVSYTAEQRAQCMDIIDTTKYQLSPQSEQLPSWAHNVILYVNESEQHNALHRDPLFKEKMNNLFSGSYKNVALKEMSEEWSTFLNVDNAEMPPQLFFASKVIYDAGGAGNMKHIESLGNLAYQVHESLEKTTQPRTSLEIKSLLKEQENRFTREKWSQDDISEFYNLSKEIIEAAPSLYTSFAPIFESISAKDMKKFMSDIFPLYQTQLVIMQNIENGRAIYDPKQLVEMRRSIKEFSEVIKGQQADSNIFDSEKMRLLEIAKTGFRNRFGLVKTPDNFSNEDLRSTQNTIRYLGNINNRTPKRESLISLYLGLKLDNKWSDFRAGKDIPFNEYLSKESLSLINPALDAKYAGYEQVSQVAGISPDQMSRFQELLQDETDHNFIGNIQTIDIKLGITKRAVDDLVDPDIYQTQQEKDIISLFLDQGKNVNTTLAKMYGVASGKNVAILPEEERIAEKIASIFDVDQWTPDQVKSIQDQIQPIGLVTNMVSKMEEEKVEERLKELQDQLVPNDTIITIFNKLGETFRQESGAMALSKDLSYLENLIVKKSDVISSEEKELVTGYLNAIREKMEGLETVSSHIQQYFEKIKKSSHLANNDILKNRIDELDKIIYTSDKSSVITSQITKDLNLVIENMRQCLGCLRKEANNDTNLSFGDYNKFFIMNREEKERGSISDEIVFFAPITMPHGAQEMSFIMDRVYGTKSPDVLISNIGALNKKYQSLKREFPESRISITITEEAMHSVGLSEEVLIKRIKELFSDTLQPELSDSLVATIPESSLSDNYIEFGLGTARESGDRKFSGIILR